jgi:hypothetical protein
MKTYLYFLVRQLKLECPGVTNGLLTDIDEVYDYFSKLTPAAPEERVWIHNSLIYAIARYKMMGYLKLFQEEYPSGTFPRLIAEMRRAQEERVTSNFENKLKGKWAHAESKLAVFDYVIAVLTAYTNGDTEMLAVNVAKLLALELSPVPKLQSAILCKEVIL